MSAAKHPGMDVTCQELVELVGDYLEGALDEASHREVEAHLAGCAGCEAYLQQVRQTIDELGHVPLGTLSDGAMAELLEAFRALRPRDR
jgi:anti-sigma factor RsiW